MTNTQFLRRRIDQYLVENRVVPVQFDHTLEDLIVSEWCAEFIQYMHNRMIFGRFRYGAMSDPKKGQYDNIGSAIKRLFKYKLDGNLEHLVDAANLAMIEFAIGNHHKRHFNSIDNGEHAEPM